MSRSSKRRERAHSVSETSQQPNEMLPPGSGLVPQPHPEPESEEQGGLAEDAAVEITDGRQPRVVTQELHDAEEKAAADARVARANKATGPKRLTDREKQQIGVLIGLLGEADTLETPIGLEEMPGEIRDSFYALGNARNLLQRGLATPVHDAETKQMTGVKLTDIALYLYGQQTAARGGNVQTKTTKANGQPVAPGARTTTKYDGLRLRIMTAENPRAVNTQGYFSWQLYQDGMTYREYMASKNYGNLVASNGSLFRGPGRNHFDWDLSHGYIALYRENEPEMIEQEGEEPVLNPKYWAINNNVSA